jgi:hypothetical protein
MLERLFSIPTSFLCKALLRQWLQTPIKVLIWGVILRIETTTVVLILQSV